MPFRQRLYTIIFEADTRAGKLFDVVLIAAILLSLAVVKADSSSSPGCTARDAISNGGAGTEGSVGAWVAPVWTRPRVA